MQEIRVDWRESLGILDPYIMHQGGVVAVTGYPTSACSTFVKLVRQAITDQGSDNISIFFNPDDELTHTRDDIIVELEQELKIRNSPSGSLSVGSNIEAAGSVTLNNISIYNEPSTYDISLGNARRIERIVQALGEQVQARRIVLILYNWHNLAHKTQRWFWKEFWINSLERFLSRGLLVVCVYQTENGNLPMSDLLPLPDCLVTLPASYEKEEREYALQDIADYLIQASGENPQVARIRAETLLMEWSNQPSVVHSRLYLHGLNLKNKK